MRKSLKTKKTQLVFDIETDNFYEQGKVIHCIVTMDTETWEVKSFGPEQIQEGVEHLDNAFALIGHNIIDFDIPFINKLYQWTPKSRIYDTLIFSRLIHPTRESHALEAWGKDLGFLKAESPNFAEFSEEMLKYCINDVKLNFKLWEKLKEGSKDGKLKRAIKLEHTMQNICSDMRHVGVNFNHKKASELEQRLYLERSGYEDVLTKTFGSWVVGNGDGRTRKKADYTKIKVVNFNPRSRQHIAKVLIDRGWKPSKTTPLGHPIVDEATLREIGTEDSKRIADYLLIQKRIAQLKEGNQAWLKLAVEEGNCHRIHNRTNSLGGTYTSRATHTHPNLGQVPAVRSPFGKECRELFIPDEGCKFIGIDMSGLELRVLAHYMSNWDGGAYGKKIVEGDIHTVNQKYAGLETRDQAKTFIYALLYGAGSEKLGSIVGGGKKEGAKLRNKFMRNINGFKQLNSKIAEKLENKNYLKGLDRRPIPVRSTHSALNFLIQSAGAILCKKWITLVNDEILKSYNGLARIVLWVHDEIQVSVSEELDLDEVGKSFVEKIFETERYYDFRCPLDGEYKIGNSWMETH